MKAGNVMVTKTVTVEKTKGRDFVLALLTALFSFGAERGT